MKKLKASRSVFLREKEHKNPGEKRLKCEKKVQGYFFTKARSSSQRGVSVKRNLRLLWPFVRPADFYFTHKNRKIEGLQFPGICD